jgi:hypothetical protein
MRDNYLEKYKPDMSYEESKVRVLTRGAAKVPWRIRRTGS